MSNLIIRDLIEEDLFCYCIQESDVCDKFIHKIAVTRKGNPLPGFCGWATKNPETNELVRLYVDPEFRRQGVATALIEAVNPVSHLVTLKDNHIAQALYRKLGFEVVGPAPEDPDFLVMRR